MVKRRARRLSCSIVGPADLEPRRKEGEQDGVSGGNGAPRRKTMDTQESLHVPELVTSLRRSFRHGARAPELLSFTPALIHLLQPTRDGEPASIYERAVKTEREISEVVGTMDAPGKTAMEIMLCLRPGTTGVRVEVRREQAARLYKVTADTFRRRERHEPTLVLTLALKLLERRMDG